MLTPDAFLKALAAITSFAFGLALLLSGDRRRPAPYFLAAFLFLIAGNQAAEAAVAYADSARAKLQWYRIATVCAALDPMALYYFASLHPTRNKLNSNLRVALVGAPAVALALLSTGAFPESLGGGKAAWPWVNVALALYTVIVYGVVLRWAQGRLLTERQDADRLLFAAMCIVALPVLPRALNVTVRTSAQEFWGMEYYAPALLPWLIPASLASLAAGAALLYLRGRSASARGIAAGLAVSLLLSAPELLSFARIPYVWPSLLLGRSGAAIRWLAFGVLVSVAALRAQMLGLGVAARRRTARVLLALTFLTVATLVALVVAELAGARGAFGWWEWSVVVAVVALSQGYRSLVDRVAHRLFGVPRTTDAQGRLEVYRAAAAQVLLEGRSASKDARLARLREELSIDEGAATLLERVAEETTTVPLSTGQRLRDRYRVKSLLGAGGAGRVFLAHDEALDREVVLKELYTPNASEDAIREARIAGAVQHPNVVTIHDVMRRGETYVLVSERVQGGSLEDLILQEGPLDERRGRAVLEGILQGLAAVHARGIVHRDLKPSNVLLQSDGTPKIADFGIARAMGEQTVVIRADQALLGTPGFLAPEMRRGEPPTPAADVYAIGQLARRCLADPDAPWVRDVLSRALAAEPADRYADAGQVLAALRAQRQ